MQFKRDFRPPGPRPYTPQRVAAAKRAIAKEQAKTPLFPTFFYNETVEERITRLDTSADASTQTMRDFVAGQWRKARAQLRTLMRLDAEQRQLSLFGVAL